MHGRCQIYLQLICLWCNKSETDAHSEHACSLASNSFQTVLPAGTSLDQCLEECHESPFKCVLVRTSFGKLFHGLETIKRMDGRPRVFAVIAWRRGAVLNFVVAPREQLSQRAASHLRWAAAESREDANSATTVLRRVRYQIEERTAQQRLRIA